MIGALKGGEGFLQASHGNRRRFRRAAHLHHRHPPQQDLCHGHAGQRGGDDRQNRHRRRRIQLSDRGAAERPGIVRGRRDELSRAGSGPLRQFSLRDRKTWGFSRDRCSARKESASIPKAISMSSTACGASCRFLIGKPSFCTTSANEEPDSEIFNCRPGYRLITTIAFTSWIPSITASRSFIIMRRRNRAVEENHEVDDRVRLRLGFHSELRDRTGARRCAGHAQPHAFQRSFRQFSGKPRLYVLPRST